MTLRCDWCGVFITNAAEPFGFLNYFGVQVTKRLCPEDRMAAVSLAGWNMARLLRTRPDALERAGA
jgi:hypothetical protein